VRAARAKKSDGSLMSAVLSLTPVTSVIILLLFASQVYYYQRHSSYVKQTDLRLQTLASERDELRDRHASRKQECDLVETRLHECSKRAVSAEEKFDHIKVDCDEQKRKLDAFKGVDVTYLQRRIAELQKLLEEQKSQWQQVKGLEADAARREHDEVLQACEVHRQDAHRLTAQLDVIKHERDNMQKLLRSQDDDLTEMREKRSVSQAELAACDSERAAAVRSTQRLTKELDAVVSSAGVKHEAAQALKERHLFDVQAQLKAAQSDARRARDELDESRAEHEACEKRLVSMAPLAADAVVSAAAGATDAAAPTLDASGYCANSPTERGRWSADGRFAPLGCVGAWPAHALCDVRALRRCRYRAYGSIEAGQCLARKRVMLIGDATMKDFAYALYQLLRCAQRCVCATCVSCVLAVRQ
jgi:septal ring factor EnvC (AmiA/AmiB activator)